MISLAVIVGTRPQIIKSSPLVKDLNARNNVDCYIINTGQHYDYEMNKQFFHELDLPEPELNLDVGPGTPNEQISKIISGLDTQFAAKRPDIAIVPGDTNSALASGIACLKSKILVAHLESGCRSNDLGMAEEVNRRILDQISHVLLCPTSDCVNNLLSEKVLAQVIENVGDTMYDSLLQCSESIGRNDATQRFRLDPFSYAFMTLHRAENTDNPRALRSVFEGVSSFKETVLFSVHPRTRREIEKNHISIPPNVKPVDPLPYFDTLRLLKDSKFVITDSGGLQKEAFWMQKPVLITRDRTEWNEIIRCGAAVLVGHDKERLAEGYREIIGIDNRIFEENRHIFGDGRAGPKAVDVIMNFIMALH
jgi:UDP-N-acetylglucosamine 2-epimerase